MPPLPARWYGMVRYGGAKDPGDEGGQREREYSRDTGRGNSREEGGPARWNPVERRGAVTPPAQPQIKTLSDAHAVAQRKLDAILAGQSM